MMDYTVFYNECMEVYRQKGEDAAKARLSTLNKSQLVELAQTRGFGNCVKLYHTKEEILNTLTIHGLGWDIDQEILAEIMQDVRRERKELLGY